jgi:hypothetical protein
MVSPFSAMIPKRPVLRMFIRRYESSPGVGYPGTIYIHLLPVPRTRLTWGPELRRIRLLLGPEPRRIRLLREPVLRRNRLQQELRLTNRIRLKPARRWSHTRRPPRVPSRYLPPSHLAAGCTLPGIRA